MISLTCPNCYASLATDENRDILYCEYCGHKILLNNKKEFTYTYHKIDDAKIKQQEVREKIELKKLENEQRESRILGAVILFVVLVLGLVALTPFLLTLLSKW